jgi:hypothetical protein
MVLKFPYLLPYQTDLNGNNLVDSGDDNTRIVWKFFPMKF